MQGVSNMQTQLVWQPLSHWQPEELLQARAGMAHLAAWHPRPHHQSRSPILDVLQFAELLFRCRTRKAVTIIKTRDHQRDYGELADLNGDVAADASNLRQVLVTGLHNGGDLVVAVQVAVHGDSEPLWR